MLPSHTIIAFVPVTLDAGHHLGRHNEVLIGGATLTVQVSGGKIGFDLDTFVLRPSEPADDFLHWIDQTLSNDSATLALYAPDTVADLLRRLPGAEHSSGVRSLSGKGRQPIIRLLYGGPNGHLSLAEACAHASVAYALANATDRFSAWVRCDIDHIAAQAEIDVIAVWRLTIDAIARETGLGDELAPILRHHLTLWLHAADRASTRIHHRDLNPLAN
jgi:hypothetical protein